MRCTRRRGDFLEESVERLFRDAFPMAQIVAGSRWIDPASGREYENDLLVQMDNTLIVVEAKSAQLPESARRGANRRLARAVKDLMVDPSIQLQRFVEYLQERSGNVEVLDAGGRPYTISDIKNKTFVRLNVTLDPIGFYIRIGPH